MLLTKSFAYKSSELGTGRKLTPSRIGNTRRSFHPVQRPAAGYGTQAMDSTGTPPVRQIPQPTQESPIPHATPTIHPTANPVTTSTSRQYEFLIVAVLLFLGYVDAATTMSESCGGGGGTESGWGKKDDEDDFEWARGVPRKPAGSASRWEGAEDMADSQSDYHYK